MACGEEEGLVEDYWIVIILCVRERRGDRFDRAGMVAVLEKFIRRLKMVLAKKEIEDVLEGDVEAGEDALYHYIICVGGEMEERLPRSKDFASSAS